MKIIRPEDYPYVNSEWVVIIQELESGSWIEEQFLKDDPDQIIVEGDKKYGIRAIAYVDYEHGVVQGWELINLVYTDEGKERESGREIRAELVKVIRDGTWNQELTYGDLGIGFHNFTVMENLEEDWTGLPNQPNQRQTAFRLLVPEIEPKNLFHDSINYLTVPQ